MPVSPREFAFRLALVAASPETLRGYRPREDGPARIRLSAEAVSGRPSDVPNRSAAILRVRKLEAAAGRGEAEAAGFLTEAAKLRRYWKLSDVLATQGIGGDLPGTRIPVYFGWSSFASGARRSFTEKARVSFYYGVVRHLIESAWRDWARELEVRRKGGTFFERRDSPGLRQTALTTVPPVAEALVEEDDRPSRFKKVRVEDEAAARRGREEARRVRFRPW